jgi:addiction module RelB/DinJ family antitoxin
MISTINFKIDTQLKKQFEDFTSSIGIPMSTLINMFIKKTLKDKEIPFKFGLNQDEKERLEAAKAFIASGGCLSDIAKQAGFKTMEDVDN